MLNRTAFVSPITQNKVFLLDTNRITEYEEHTIPELTNLLFVETNISKTVKRIQLIHPLPRHHPASHADQDARQ